MIIWLVIPCFNEEDTLPLTAGMFTDKLQSLIDSGTVDSSSRVLFVDDGSRDGTWNIIEGLAHSNPLVLGMALSRNRGHQNALLAGLMEARTHCDATISMDCDGQDDIDAVDAMVREFSAGYDVVYGVRSNRDTDSSFKRHSAEAFYKLMGKLGADVVFNHADYRLMSARALDGLADFQEVNLFLRGLVPLVGFPSTTVEYERRERRGGESHYPLGKMVGLAIDGITSLSVKPIRMIMTGGFVFFLVGIGLAIWAATCAITGQAVAGWASTVCVISIIGGLQLLALGIIGEYVGKIYLETKSRPRFIIEQRTWDSSGD